MPKHNPMLSRIEAAAEARYQARSDALWADFLGWWSK